MRKHLLFVLLLLVLFSSLPFVHGKVGAASLQFDNAALNVKKGDTVSLQVNIDPKGEQITSTDIYVLFDKTILSAKSVLEGTYFPTVLSDIQPGRVYLAGLVEDPSAFKSVTGIVATISFTAIADGTTNVTFDCRSASDSSKIIKNDINATNIIVCADNKSSLVTVGAISSLPTTSSGNGGTGTSSASLTGTPTPTSTPIPTATPTPTKISTNSATLSAAPVSGNADAALALLIPGVLFMLFAGVFKFVGRM